jgi:hypothetical protein
MNLIIGIDPGKKGAIAIMDFETGNLMELFNIPYKDKFPDLAEIFLRIGKVLEIYYYNTQNNSEIKGVYFEKITAIGGMGVTSAFTFGLGYGMLMGAFEMTAYQMYWVQPKEWQKRILGGLNHGDKGQAIDYVKQKVINFESFLRTKDKSLISGLADAICICEYGRQELSNKKG